MNTTAIEKRIAAALSEDITSSDLVSLLVETEAAISEAEATAEAERAKALDLLASPNAAKARTAMEDAAFARDRLRTHLPRLRDRLREVQAAEYAAAWEPEYKRVEGTRDELAAELAATYPKLVAQLVHLLGRIEECDREVSRINGSAPDGESRRLRQVEVVARALDSFSRDNPSITKELQLPDWERSNRLAWPPPKAPLAALVAAAIPAFQFPGGGEWWEGREKLAARQEAEQARLAAYYEKQERAREEREKAEWEARAAQRRAGKY
jgi:hypothetical protein